MKGIVRLCGTGLFKFVALSLSIALLAWIWWKYPDQMVSIEKGNLSAISFAADHMPQGIGNRFEAFVRGFGFEKTLLVLEAVAVVKLLMLALGRTFRRGARRTRHR